MNLEEIWLAHLQQIVDKEAQNAGGSLRAGYRSVATTMAKSEEYIYQLYKQKPKADGTPRVVSLEFAKAMARHYAEGRPLDWINTPPLTGAEVRSPSQENPEAVAPIATWPFKQVGYRRFMTLPREAQREIDAYLEGLVTTWETKLAKQNASRKRR